MTVTLSYLHGFMEDCGNTNLAAWQAGETEDGLTATLTCDNDNEFNINATVAAGNKTVVYEFDCTNISTDTYSKYKFGYKTLDLLIKAKIVLVFTVGSQTILDETSSTSWTLGSGTVTAGKTLDKVQLWATQAVGDVLYDFLTLYKDDFSLGNTLFGMDIDFPPKTATLSIPSSWTDRPQILGSANTLVRISCDLTQNTWKRGDDTIDAQVFLEMIQNMDDYPWRWFDSGEGLQFKVYKIHPHLHWVKQGDATVRRLDLTFEEYSRGNLAAYGHTSRWGITS